jgi:ADP-L-glycero-D-manno-heptose 6-epimerase
MTYIVTGAAGFIGARVVEEANRRGVRLVSVDAVRGVNAFETRPEHRELDFGTTLDIDALFPWLEGHHGPIDAVIHLGACTDTMELDEAIHQRLNVDYTQNLWNWCAAHRVPLVYASSASTYGAGENGWDDDERRLDVLQPLNPYGWSKHRIDLWALERERAGVSPPTWAGFKFFNVYGFGERHKGRMASVVLHGFDQICQTGKVRLFRSHKAGVADGDQRRDFVSVDDVVDVLFFAASGRIPRGIFNLGTGRARSFHDLATATFAALGRAPNIEFFDMPVALRERYQYFTEATIARLRAVGYERPFTSLEDGVERCVRRLMAPQLGGGSAS